MISCGGGTDGSVIENNVIAEDAAGDGIEYTGSGNCAVTTRGNIIYGNGSSAITGTSSISGETVEYNDSYGNGTNYTSGTGNLNADPIFTDATDYRIDAASPCVNAGNPSASYNDADGTRNDMGAYGGKHGNW